MRVLKRGRSQAILAALLVVLLAGAGCGDDPSSSPAVQKPAASTTPVPTATVGPSATATPARSRPRPAGKREAQPAGKHQPEDRAGTAEPSAKAERVGCNSSVPRELARCESAAE